MKKLGEIENLAAFEALLAAGADLNQDWCGRPVIESFFIECMRLGTLCRDGVSFAQLRLLLEAGADPAPLFDSPYEEYSPDGLLQNVRWNGQILAAILGGSGAAQALRARPDRRELLSRCAQVARALLDIPGVIEMTGQID